MAASDLPLLLMPGLLCDAAVWQAQRRELAGLHCIVPDYGELDSLADMAARVLQEVGAPRLRVAGHSMGARVALQMARLAPERIERLALLDTGVTPLPEGQAGEAERAQRMALVALAQGSGMREMGRQWALGMVHPARVDTPVFDAIVDMVGRKTPQVFEAQIRALLSRPDARPVLQGLRCPTLLLCGRQDAWSPLARHEEMQALLPGAALVVVEDSGHMTPMEQPAAVNAALRHWLQAPPGQAMRT